MRYYLTSLISGFVMLSLELLGVRMLAPYFGYSIYVFGVLIGVILFALSIGYWFGGFWADRDPRSGTVFTMLLGSVFYLTLVILWHERLLQAFAHFSIVYGSLWTALALFGPIMVLLATLSPYLVKLLAAQRERGPGYAAGSLYAVSTIGSLAGTFLTSFYIVPQLGVRFALNLNLFLMAGLTALWLWGNTRLRYAGSALVLVAILSSQYTAPERSSSVLAASESQYSHLEVADYGEFLGLRKDYRHQMVHSVYPKSGV